jgi:hypothetical protein
VREVEEVREEVKVVGVAKAGVRAVREGQEVKAVRVGGREMVEERVKVVVEVGWEAGEEGVVRAVGMEAGGLEAPEVMAVEKGV